jgi:hypothetical protein
MSFRSASRRRRSRALAITFVVSALAALVGYPKVQSLRVEKTQLSRLSKLHPAAGRPLFADEALALRVRRLGPLLASWETIGGCGAGSSVGGGNVKWIGRGTRGGLFQLQLMQSYLPISDGDNFSSGYNLSTTLMVDRDITEKWNVAVMVPYLYKYYRDYYALPADISNAGVGDINVLLTRRFGAINSTSLTLSAGLPTGSYDAKYKNDQLTQEKQLGLGRATATLILDHTFDEIWGLFVVGGALGYRGGENKLGNYRAPVGTVYGYGGYFLGPFVPALGLTFTQFAEHDRDRGQKQNQALTTVAGNASIEWSNDYIAVLVGASFPFAVPSADLQPWVLAVGLAASPF